MVFCIDFLEKLYIICNMKTKTQPYIEIVFWSLMLGWSISQNEEAFELSFNVNHPIWLVTIWIVGMWASVKSLFCINRPKGATKHRGKHYIASKKSVDDIKIKKEIKRQTKQAMKILALWIVFILVEGLFYLLNVISEKTIIVGAISLRVFERLFVLVWCPFGAIMKNKCCTTCRIYGWDQLMLNSPLVFIPSILSYALILISTIYFIEWEISIKRHPERFLQVSNEAIRCPNCHELCGRCIHKWRVVRLSIATLFLL